MSKLIHVKPSLFVIYLGQKFCMVQFCVFIFEMIISSAVFEETVKVLS